MGDVRYIDNGDTILTDQGRNEDCVEHLERLLEKARNGEIVGVAEAVQYADGSTGHGVGGFIHNQRIVGALMTRVVKLSQ
jgi:hypothetical protein